MSALVADVLVDLIRDRDDVVVLAEPGDRLELWPREHPAGRIVRCVDDDRSGAWRERLGELIGIELEGGRPEWNEDRRRTANRGVGPVILVERLEDDDLVTWVAYRKKCGDHRLGRSAGDRQHRLGIDVHRVKLS